MTPTSRQSLATDKSMTDYPEKKFQARNIEVNYAEGPDNGPPLLLIHGLGGHWPNWEPVIDQFSENWHIYAIDLRGHGDSGRVPGGYSYDDYHTEVLEFIVNVVKKPTFVVGHSLGGVTAASLSATAPELVAAAALEDPPLYIREWFNDSPFAAAFQATLDIRKKNLGIKDTAIEFKKIDSISTDESIVMKAISVTMADPEVWAVAIDGTQTESWDPDTVLADAKSPVLLMQANPDMGGALRDVEATRTIDLLEQGRHVKWDDTGHGMHNAEPERFVQLVNAFFRQVLRKKSS
jgi:pimeloyl-ACP methyl ester carboxylesterase